MRRRRVRCPSTSTRLRSRGASPLWAVQVVKAVRAGVRDDARQSPSLRRYPSRDTEKTSPRSRFWVAGGTGRCISRCTSSTGGNMRSNGSTCTRPETSLRRSCEKYRRCRGCSTNTLFGTTTPGWRVPTRTTGARAWRTIRSATRTRSTRRQRFPRGRRWAVLSPEAAACTSKWSSAARRSASCSTTVTWSTTTTDGRSSASCSAVLRTCIRRESSTETSSRPISCSIRLATSS